MNTNIELRVITLLTLLSTFLMGFTDAYAYLTFDELLVSAQTGNVVLMGIHYDGDILSMLPNIISLLGFLLGAFIGEGYAIKTHELGLRKYQPFMVFQVIVYGLVIILAQADSWGYLMICGLGFISGFNMTLFNNVRNVKVNSGVMSNNIRMLMNHLYKVIVFQNKTSIKSVLSIGASIFVFIFGVFTYVVLSRGTLSSVILGIPIILSIMSIFFIEINIRKE